LRERGIDRRQFGYARLTMVRRPHAANFRPFTAAKSWMPPPTRLVVQNST
jgi:hypothetical protein